MILSYANNIKTSFFHGLQLLTTLPYVGFKVILGIVFFVWFSFSFAQVNLQATLSPDVIFIGDTASLNIQLGVDKVEKVELPALGDSLNKYIEINEVKIDSSQRGRNKMYAINVTITAFEPGDFLVNSIPFMISDKLYQTESFQLKVKNVELNPDIKEPYPIKPIMKEHVSWWEKNRKNILYGALILLGVLAIAGLLYYFFRKRKKHPYKSKPLLPPYEEAKENLKKLDKQNYLSKEEYDTYYTDLSYILRRYLSRRFEFPGMALLSSDFANYLEQKEILLPKETHELRQFLEDADRAKFAKEHPNLEQTQTYRKWVEGLIDKTKPLLENVVDKEHE